MDLFQMGRSKIVRVCKDGKRDAKIYYVFQIELAYFEHSCHILSMNAQYRWYLTVYRIGNFASRSIASLIRVKRVWVFCIIQVSSLSKT